MKNKIRRAFDLTKPNVLNRVLEDCPAPANAPAKKKRRPLSDRTVRFISVAASFAIIISAAGGGFLYFRDYFAGQGAHSGTSGEQPNTAPDSNLSWDTPEPNETEGVMISEEYAREIALEYVRQEDMGACKIVSCELVDNAYYKVGISGEILMWYTEVLVDAYSGKIIDPTVPGDMISADDAKEMALQDALTKYSEAYLFDFRLVDDSYYLIGIGCIGSVESSASASDAVELIPYYYCMDAYSGKPLEPDWTMVQSVTEDQALKLAAYYAESHFEYYTLSDCTYIFRSGLPSYYAVTVTADVPDGQMDFPLEIIELPAYITVTPPDDAALTMSGARDIALGMWGHDVEYIHCLKISENGDFYTVYYELGKYAYEFHIDFDGNVLYDSGEQFIGLRSDQQMTHLIGWEKARNIALAACGREAHEFIGFTYEYCPGDPDYYHLELYFPDDAFSYRIGALNGELLEGNVSPMHLDFHVSDGPVYTPIDDLIHNYDHNIRLVVITSADELAQLHEDSGYEVPTQYDEDFFKESALLIVDYYYGSSAYQIRITDILMDAEGNYTVSVAYCAWELGDCMVVTGSLLAEVYQPIDPTAQVDLNITQLEEDKWNDLISSDTIIDIEKATQIAMEYTGHLEDYLAGTVTDLACKFDEHGNPAAYYVYFCVGNEYYEVGILATSGEVLFCNGWAVDEPILDGPFTKEDATQVALSCLAGADTYPVIECHQIGTDPGRIIYMVVCRKPGMSVTTMVDGNTLRIMDYGTQSLEGVLTEQQVRAIAYKACDLEEEGPAATAMLGIFNDGVPFYCVKVYWDETVHVVVMDATTGEVLNQIQYENTRIPGHIISQEAALEYALANAFVSLADAEDPTVVHDPDSQTYTVTFRYQGELCTAIVDDYYGSIIDLYWVVDE